MTYYIYHIPGKKIGVTRDLENRVVKQQGYNWNEFEVLYEDKDINIISKKELKLQKQYGYRIDDEPYNKLKCNNMRINVTEQTTTFPCPLNKLKGQLLDNKLHMCVTMRSNDLWYGFCNDQYQFSKLLELVCKETKLDMGTYYHFAHNLHIYSNKLGL